MKEAMKKVDEFQRKVKVSKTADLNMMPALFYDVAVLQTTAASLTNYAKLLETLLEQGTKDVRVLRAHLMCEELAETIKAMIAGNELGVLDGLADLIYVVIGTAVTFDLPLPEAFDEVHKSNMTKEKQENDAARDRIRAKGPNYKPANLEQVLREYRRQW